MNKQKIIFIGLFALFSQFCKAQSISPATLNSSGGSGVIGGNTYEYSIGEMTLVSTAGSGSIIVTQGLLQPSANSSGIKESLMTDEQLSVFPVPSSSVLYLQPEFNGKGKLSFTLLDVAGKNIMDASAELRSGREKQQMDLGTIAPGNYMLRVIYESDGQTSSKTFKIQKTQ